MVGNIYILFFWPLWFEFLFQKAFQIGGKVGGITSIGEIEIPDEDPFKDI